MSVRTIHIAFLSLILAVVAVPFARAADEKPHGHGGPVAFVLKHGDELKLTDEQKTKLQDLAKETQAAAPADKADKKASKGAIMEKINAILTPEQVTELKALHEKEPKKGDKPKPTN